MADLDEDALQAIAEFLGQYLSDQRAGEVRSLEDYQALYPGYEELIALELRNIHELTSKTAHTPPTWRSSQEIRFSSVTAEPGVAYAMELPRTLGPYELEEEVGRGGQGAVYRSIDTRSGEVVALKTLHAGAAGSAQALMRFEREAALTTRLADPAICTVREAGVLEGTPFIAMDYVAGDSLDATLRGLRRAVVAGERGAGLSLGPPPPPSASTENREWTRIVGILRFHEKLARALHGAHELGIIHRDVKPGNVIDGPDHQPVLLDFGLARQLEDGGMKLTLSGDLFGTPAYMSPEQVTRQAITLDRRTDVYSLGVTLYECLTLHRPFEEATRDKLFQAIIAKPIPDPRRRSPAIASELKTVLDTALAKDRDHRYQTALDFAEDLRRVAASESIRARPPSAWARTRSWAKRNPAVAASLTAVMLILSVALVVTLRSLSSEQEQRRIAEAAARQTRLEADAWQLDDLREQTELLWPALPRNAPRMREWLQSARQLMKRIEDHHRDEAPDGPLQPRALAASGENAGPRALQKLMAGEDTLDDQIREIDQRLELATEIRASSVDRLTDAWQQAAREVANDPRFTSFELEPICGLVPLGRNPRSEFQEFAVALSGTTIPEMDPLRGYYRLRSTDAIVLILLPGGTVEMGSAHTEPGRNPNEELVERSLEPFFLARHEVSQAQYLRIMGVNPSEVTKERISDYAVDDRHPVESVTWNEALRFAERLDLTLPTEAQWEWACRAGHQTAWHWGDHVEDLELRENLADRSVVKAVDSLKPRVDWDDGFPATAPVGSFPPNAWGLQNMHGNVEEWCRDSYHATPSEVEPVGSGACAPLRDGPEVYVCRGGSWQRRLDRTRSAARSGRPPDRIGPTIGIRVARAAR